MYGNFLPMQGNFYPQNQNLRSLTNLGSMMARSMQSQPDFVKTERYMDSLPVFNERKTSQTISSLNEDIHKLNEKIKNVANVEDEVAKHQHELRNLKHKLSDMNKIIIECSHFETKYQNSVNNFINLTTWIKEFSQKRDNQKDFLKKLRQKETELPTLQQKLRELISTCQDLNKACFRVASENGKGTLLSEAQTAASSFQNKMKEIDYYNKTISDNERIKQSQLLEILKKQKKKLNKYQKSVSKQFSKLNENKMLRNEIKELESRYQTMQTSLSQKRNQLFEIQNCNISPSKISEQKKTKRIIKELAREEEIVMKNQKLAIGALSKKFEYTVQENNNLLSLVNYMSDYLKELK